MRVLRLFAPAAAMTSVFIIGFLAFGIHFSRPELILVYVASFVGGFVEGMLS